MRVPRGALASTGHTRVLPVADEHVRPADLQREVGRVGALDDGGQRALLDDGHAYHSTSTADDVKAYKEQHGADRGFRGAAEANGAVRLRIPDAGYTSFEDLVRGESSIT